MEHAWAGRSLIIAMGFLFALLLVFQLIGFIASKKTNESWTNYRQRVKTWWLILLPLSVVFLMGPLPMLILWCLLSSWAVYEMLSVAPLDPFDRKIERFLISSPWLLTLGLWLGIPWFWCMIALLLSAPLTMVINGCTNEFLQRMSYIQWILVQIVGALSFGTLLILQAPGSTPSVGDAAVFAWVLFVTQMHDALQYCAGKLLGKNPILPRISPKKTWEGFLGGLFLTSLLGASLYKCLSLNFIETFFVSATICFFGFWSDVMMSAIKRGLNIKDYGFILKGHGGLLDRIDSLLLALPIAYILLTFLS